MYLSLCNFLNRQILGLSKKLIRLTYWMLKTEIHIAIDSVWKIISLKHPGRDCLHMWREANAEVHFPEPAWHIWFEKNNCAAPPSWPIRSPWTVNPAAPEDCGFNGKLPVLKDRSSKDAIRTGNSFLSENEPVVTLLSPYHLFLSFYVVISILCIFMYQKPISNVRNSRFYHKKYCKEKWSLLVVIKYSSK